MYKRVLKLRLTAKGADQMILKATAAVRTTRFKTKLKRQYPLFLMLLPAFVAVLIFSYYPMYGAQIAFREYKMGMGITDGVWVGWQYFEEFFNSYYFERILVNTLTLSIYSLIASFFVVIILSLSLHCLQNQFIKKTVQTVIYLPHFISTVVIVGILLRMLNPNLGALAKLIQLLGGTERDLMGIPEAFPHLYVWSGIWQNAGWGTIIYLATLAGIDPQQHEAAVIDGASRLQRVFYVDIPALIPTAVIMLIMNTGSIMNVGFEKVLLMQNGLNQQASEVISTYVYKIGIAAGNPQYSLSAAIGLFNSVVNFVMIVVVNSIAKALKQNSLW